MLLQNTHFNVMEESAGKSPDGAGATSIEAEAGVAVVPRPTDNDFVTSVRAKLDNIRRGLALVIADDDEDEDEEDLPYSQETDEDRPEGGIATKNAARDPHDARKALELNKVELDKQTMLNEFVKKTVTEVDVEAEVLIGELEIAATLTAAAPMRAAGRAARATTSFVPTRPALEDMMRDPDTFRVTCDLVILALKSLATCTPTLPPTSIWTRAWSQWRARHT